MTFNLLHGGAASGRFGDGQHLERRLDMAVQALRRLDPDVVGLQEASVGGRRGNVAARLAKRLGLHYVHAVATERVLGGVLGRLAVGVLDFGEGPAILSRYPIGPSRRHDLPACGRPFEPRVLLQAEIDTPRGRVAVFSTHTAGDPCHTRDVAARVLEHRGGTPGILMGDFNATEGSLAIAALTEAAGLIDAFRTANPRDPGPTVWQRVDVRERMARRRVDYVFLAPACLGTAAVRSSRVVIDAPGRAPDGGVLWPSDHYAVLAEVDLFPPAPTACTGPARTAS